MNFFSLGSRNALVHARKWFDFIDISISFRFSWCDREGCREWQGEIDVAKIGIDCPSGSLQSLQFKRANFLAHFAPLPALLFALFVFGLHRTRIWNADSIYRPISRTLYTSKKKTWYSKIHFCDLTHCSGQSLFIWIAKYITFRLF